MRHAPTKLSRIRRAVLLVMFSSFFTPIFASDVIKLGGTGSALTTMKIATEEFTRRNAGQLFEVVPSLGSSGGIKAVAAGAIDIGLSARPFKDAERPFGLAIREIARTPLVVATAAPQAPAGLSMRDLARMIEGTKTTWSDGSRMRVVLRPTTDAEHALLEKLSPEIAAALAKAHATPGLQIAVTDQDAANALETVSGSIGTSTLSLITSERRRIKPLTLDGVAPSVNALADGSYIHYKPLYIVTTTTVKPAVKAFLEFLESADGVRILKENGYLALTSIAGR